METDGTVAVGLVAVAGCIVSVVAKERNFDEQLSE